MCSTNEMTFLEWPRGRVAHIALQQSLHALLLSNIETPFAKKKKKGSELETPARTHSMLIVITGLKQNVFVSPTLMESESTPEETVMRACQDFLPAASSNLKGKPHC